MVVKADEKYMKLALELARRGHGQTSPNPMVGAVMVKNDRVVGQGYHEKAGGPHAEIVALNKARGAARGATLYVNLEPCCHYGRTHPCTDAIIKAGIKEVVYSINDPNPTVNGKGAALLRRAAIKVTSGQLKDESEKLNEVYVKFIRTGKPFVILKTAESLDGRIATASGDSKWISGPEARKFAHQLRADSDAVVVGAGTVLADNPHLTVRLVRGKNPYRIILTRHPNFPTTINLFRHNRDARTILATSRAGASKFKVKNVTVWTIEENKHGLLLSDFLEKAAQFGLISILVEGGGRLATSLIHEGLVDKQYLLIAPMIIGRGTEAVGELSIRKLADAVRYKEWLFEPCGQDVLFTGYPRKK